MYAFQWQLPGETEQTATLQIHSRHGWFGRKVLTVGQQVVFSRGRFAGIETRFDRPGGSRVELRLERIPGSPIWRPGLFCDGRQLPERLGQDPPPLVDRPRSLAVITGLTYLTMLMGVVMLPSIGKILNAAYLPQDDRRLVLSILDPNRDPDALQIEPPSARLVAQNEPGTLELTATGGTPPYAWKADGQSWPRSWVLEEATGRISFTLSRELDYLGIVHVTDAAGATAQRPIVIAVQPAVPAPSGRPTIQTLSLPPAVAGVAYEGVLDAQGGVAPLTWKTVGKKRLPEGLRLDKERGTIAGLVPVPSAVRIADDTGQDTRPAWMAQGAVHYPLLIQVHDASYAPSQDINPWIVPFLCTAICLLGYWNMRQWGVYVFALLILVQFVFKFSAAETVPIAAPALAIQIVLWFVGAVQLRRML
jgi:hypothetical protein